MTIVHHLLLVLSGGAIASAALRVASLAAPAGLERAVAAAPIGVSVIVAEALMLGRVELAGSPFALAAAAALTWVVARFAVPAPALPAERELSDWIARVEPRRPPAALVIAGAIAGYVAWALLRPVLGYDGATYHLATVVGWVQSGTTGSAQNLIVDLPVGNYPLTNEAALAWAVGLSQSFVPVAVWSGALLGLMIAAARLGLRSLGVGIPVTVAALAAFCLTPLALRSIVQAETDFAAVTWLAVTAALGVAARERPPLLAPMLLAAALAVGTKTTVAPLALVAVVLAFVALRSSLRPLARGLAAAAVAGIVAGGVWYVRNTVDHGSPLWPLVAGPWGDPLPRVIENVEASLLERPSETLDADSLRLYRDVVAGGLVLAVGALTAPAWARGRAVVVAALATLLALLAWANAPFTGAPEIRSLGGVVFSTLRYALPALVAAAATVAVAGRGRREPVALAIAAAAITWNVVRYLDVPYLPYETALVGLALAGAVLVPAIAWLARARPLAAGAALAVAAALGLAAAAPGYLDRHARTGEFDGPLIAWMADQPRDVDRVAVSPSVIGTLADDDLERRLELIGPRETCAQIDARVRAGWVVTGPAPRDAYPPLSVDRCLAGAEPRLESGGYRIFGSP